MMGATHFYAIVNDAHQVIAVGEVQEVTVSYFANAVSFKNKSKYLISLYLFCCNVTPYYSQRIYLK
jgi:hypothetical protein